MRFCELKLSYITWISEVLNEVAVHSKHPPGNVYFEKSLFF